MSVKPSRPLDGVEFPTDPKGERSTTWVNQGTFEAAMRNVDPAAADKIKTAKGWRFAYAKHVVTQVKTAAKSEANAYKIAEDGSKYLHDQMRFVRDGETSLAEAMEKFQGSCYKTATIKGQGVKTDTYRVPYGDKVLSGAELSEQIEKWVRQGVIEMTCGSSLQKCVENPQWLDLSDRYFVLFGAASAMGPYPLLMAMGANVIALDLDREGIWQHLFKIARDSPGQLIFPVSEDPAGKSDSELAKIAGCNLLTKTPEIRTWLNALYPEKQLICGAYAYLDGPLFVKVSVAMDAIIRDLVKLRKVKPAICYLCTPTDAHVVPQTAMTAAKANFNKQPMWQGLFASLLNFAPPKFRMTKNFQKPVEGTDLSVVDAIVPDQGPNYILAKRLQHWRSILSRRDGCVVSTNIAPSTATKSVVSNKMFALAYEGMHHYKPVEVFYQDTSNAVMTGLMLNDLNDATSAANPARKLANPMCLFSENSFHGGAWRCAYKFGTVGTGAVVAALFSKFLLTPYLMAYNFFQVYGWGTALLGLINHVAAGKTTGLWEDIGGTVSWFQYLAGLEVLHAAVGAVRSGTMTVFIQVLSRFAVVASLNNAAGSFAADNDFTKMMLFAWSLTEVIRYLHYGLPSSPYLLTFLRYTLFIVLYPMGVTGELGTLHHAATTAPPATDKLSALWLLQKFYAVTPGLPVLVFIWAAGLFGLYTHMLAQRGKVLGKAAKKASGTKKNQ
eukprot:TRINITY_DN445_c1_g1_i1.p1 TRINITY_DN445_c1_g1~~TRINITY_DN445_c1_g1_i1.p1  ORF type:complete len:725 (+),score=348.11 TRINITY_DN445_c1_g1_i1:57-2231(+)